MIKFFFFVDKREIGKKKHRSRASPSSLSFEATRPKRCKPEQNARSCHRRTEDNGSKVGENTRGSIKQTRALLFIFFEERPCAASFLIETKKKALLRRPSRDSGLYAAHRHHRTWRPARMFVAVACMAVEKKVRRGGKGLRRKREKEKKRVKRVQKGNERTRRTANAKSKPRGASLSFFQLSFSSFKERGLQVPAFATTLAQQTQRTISESIKGAFKPPSLRSRAI